MILNGNTYVLQNLQILIDFHTRSLAGLNMSCKRRWLLHTHLSVENLRLPALHHWLMIILILSLMHLDYIQYDSIVEDLQLQKKNLIRLRSTNNHYSIIILLIQIYHSIIICGIFSHLLYPYHRCPFPIGLLINRGASFAHCRKRLMIDGIPVAGPNLFLPKGHCW